MAFDHKTTSRRLADNFLELRQERREELARSIERELEYVAGKVASDMRAETSAMIDRLQHRINMADAWLAGKGDLERFEETYAETKTVRRT